MRLAAAHALLDRYSDQVMANLTGMMDESIRWRADTLLRQKTYEPFNLGNSKILFHPMLEGDAFRAEAAKEQDYLFSNTSMGFVVKTGTMYELKILAGKLAGGAAFSVTVEDPGTGNHFQKDFEVTEDQLVA